MNYFLSYRENWSNTFHLGKKYSVPIQSGKSQFLTLSGVQKQWMNSLRFLPNEHTFYSSLGNLLVIFILSWLKIFVLRHRKHFSILLFALIVTWWFLCDVFQNAFLGTSVHVILKGLTIQNQYWAFMFVQLMQILLARWQTEEKFWLIPNLVGVFWF